MFKFTGLPEIDKTFNNIRIVKEFGQKSVTIYRNDTIQKLIPLKPFSDEWEPSEKDSDHYIKFTVIDIIRDRVTIIWVTLWDTAISFFDGKEWVSEDKRNTVYITHDQRNIYFEVNDREYRDWDGNVLDFIPTVDNIKVFKDGWLKTTDRSIQINEASEESIIYISNDENLLFFGIFIHGQGGYLYWKILDRKTLKSTDLTAPYFLGQMYSPSKHYMVDQKYQYKYKLKMGTDCLDLITAWNGDYFIYNKTTYGRLTKSNASCLSMKLKTKLLFCLFIVKNLKPTLKRCLPKIVFVQKIFPFIYGIQGKKLYPTGHQTHVSEKICEISHW